MTKESREFRKAMAGRPSLQEMQAAEAIERQRIAARAESNAHIIARSNSAFSFFAQIKPDTIPEAAYDALFESAEAFLTALWDDGVRAIKAARDADEVEDNAPNTESTTV